jgi:hypothetical protein
MHKSSLVFFVCLLAICSPLLIVAQTTLGDQRLPEEKIHVETTRSHRPTKERSVRLKKVNVKHTPRYEYYARVEKVAKEKQRMLRKMDEPQYTNPLYYGHKRPPKRHEVHKMRYCKECGIRH